MDPLSVPTVPDAIEGMKKLHAIGKDISIITARSNQESWKVERTLSWMRVHFPFVLEDRIHFVNHFSADALPKSQVCQSLWVTLMIDDALENAYELCHAGIATVLIERPWNRDIEYVHPLLYRVRDWHEIIQHLE
jgi:5' nucleotidase, deoxy (Pyrimidine), cytosolic type C protein (NT5C)